MAISKLNFPTKVTNGGATAAGVLTSTEFNRIPSKIDEIIDALPDGVAWSDVQGKPSTFPPSSHVHDDRYYTESEVNAKLDEKCDALHTHSAADIDRGTFSTARIPALSASKITSGTFAAARIPRGIDITGNAGSATKLETARTLWGQSFDGSADVSGDITDAGVILPSDSTKDIGSNDKSWRHVYAEWLGSQTGKDFRLASADGHTDMKIDKDNHYVGIGIGDDSPSERLTVGGNILASAYYQSSDIVLKENIEEIADIEKADDIAFKQFNYKGDDTQYYGVIAQEVEAAGLENLVRQGEFKSVDYISLLCLKMAAMEKKIAELERRLKNE